MASVRLVVRLLTPVSVLLMLAGLYLGLSRPTLVETPLGAVRCAAAFGPGTTSGATQAGQAGCAALTSEREVWSVTLVTVSLGLLLGLVWTTASAAAKGSGRSEDAEDAEGGQGDPGRYGGAPDAYGADGPWRPLDPSAGWADYPGQPPVTRPPGTPPAGPPQGRNPAGGSTGGRPGATDSDGPRGGA